MLIKICRLTFKKRIIISYFLFQNNCTKIFYVLYLMSVLNYPFSHILMQNQKWLFYSLISQTCTYIIDQIVLSKNKPDVFRDTDPYLNKISFYSKDTIEDKALYNSPIALSTVRSILNLIYRRRSSTASLYSKEIPRFTCIFHCSIRNWKTDCFQLIALLCGTASPMSSSTHL